MGDIVTDGAIMAALGRQMTQAVARQAVSAGNLANLETPGYKARELKFSEVLSDELAGSTLAATNARHFSTETVVSSTPTPTESAGLQARRDGNNVQLDRELLSMGKAAGDFTAAQTVLAAKFKLIRYAISEGR